MHRTTQRFSPLRRFRSPSGPGCCWRGAVALVFSLGTAASASAAPVYWIVNANSGNSLARTSTARAKTTGCSR